MKLFTRAGLSSAVFVVLATSAAFAQTSWDMPTPYGDGIFHTKNIHQFAQEVKTATNGSLTITVHSANSLFSHAEIKDAVVEGSVPIGEFLLSRLANEDPIFALDSIPFLASSYDEEQKLWAASREAVSARLAEEGLTVLFAVPWPGQSLYLKNEVTDPAQMQGLKFRAYNVATERLATLLGATPTQVEETDVPTAFSTGRVEAMITSPSTGANAKAWDFVTYYIDTQAWLPKNIVVVNTAALEALGEDERKALLEAAAAAEARGLEMSMEETTTKIGELEAGGMKVSHPSAALAARLREIGRIMTAEWEAGASDAGKAAVAAYRNQ